MRSLHLASALSVVALAMPVVTAAGTRIRPVHEERLKLSPSARRALVLEDLESILKGPASGGGIATRPYLSRELGLCRRDVVQLFYATTGWGRAIRETPEGVFSVVAQYHYLGPRESRSFAAWQEACHRLSGTDEYWASSGADESYVAFALSALEQAVKDVRSGGAVTLTCEEEGADCKAEFLAAAPKVTNVSPCAERSLNCYRYEMGNWDVTIVVEYVSNAPHTTIKLAPAPILLT